MTARRPVFMMNNYSMRAARERVALGTYPAQHLWGYPIGSVPAFRSWLLPRRSLYDTRVLRGRRGRVIRNGVVKWIGDPIQAVEALRAGRRGAVIYAADQSSATLVLALKRLRLVAPKIAVLVHHPPPHRWQRWLLQGADELMVLNELTREALLRVAAAPASLVRWGPDLESAVYRPRSADITRHFTAAGKTNRDYSTLRAVAATGRLDGSIFDGKQVTEIRGGVAHTRPGLADYPVVVEAMRASAAVVVTLKDPGVLAGLTEVADAIALDRPVIVTASSAFPYDIVGDAAGLQIAHDDARALASALAQAFAGELGGAGRLSRQYNMTNFAGDLETVFGRLDP